MTLTDLECSVTGSITITSTVRCCAVDDYALLICKCLSGMNWGIRPNCLCCIRYSGEFEVVSLLGNQQVMVVAMKLRQAGQWRTRAIMLARARAVSVSDGACKLCYVQVSSTALLLTITDGWGCVLWQAWCSIPVWRWYRQSQVTGSIRLTTLPLKCASWRLICG